MFDFSLSKQELLTPLLLVAGAVDKKQRVPILSNILVKSLPSLLSFTATDLDIEITGTIPCESIHGSGVITVSSKKLIDIIRSLDEDAVPTIAFHEKSMTIKTGQSQFKLLTLPADDYPDSEHEKNEVEIVVNREKLIHLFQCTHFAMAMQDLRVYLNGLLLDIDAKGITAVATDGHRMAIAKLLMPLNATHQRLVLPRKGVQEALHLLSAVDDETVLISAGLRQFNVNTKHYSFSTKLLETRFPSYHKAIPVSQDKFVVIDKDILKRTLSRITVLTNEKARTIILEITPGQLKLIANNMEQEEAFEVLAAQVEGGDLQIAMNANYLTDVLQYIKEGPLRLSFANADSSILMEPLHDEQYTYIIMPMKL